MKYIVMGKNIEIDSNMEDTIVSKLEVLEKYFLTKGDVECRVMITSYKVDQKVEVTIPTKFAILRAEVVNEDIYNGIDDAVEKLERQVRKAKTRLSRKNKESFARIISMEEEEKTEKEIEEKVVKTKYIRVEKMDLDKAIGSLTMLGHDFFIYKDSEKENIAVVYKRKKGGYGLIEVEE